MKSNILLLAAASLGFTAQSFATPLLSIGEHADLFVDVDGSISYTDNLTLDENDTLDDFRFIVDPGLVLELGRGLTNLNASLNAHYGIVRYADNTVFDTELWNVVANASLTGARYTLDASGGYVERQQNQSDVNAIRTLIIQKTLFGEGNLRYMLSQKFSFGLGGRASRVEYDGGTNIDRDYFEVPVDLFYELSPKLDASVGFRYRLTELDNDLGNTDDYFYNVGLEGSLTEKFSTNLRLGYQQREFSGDRDSEGTITLLSTSDFDFSATSLVRLRLNRDFATGGEGQSIEQTGIGLTLFQALGPKLRGNFGGGYTYSDYENSSREDNTYRLSAGLNYQINELFSVNGRYTFRDNDSNVDLNSYTENLVSVGANFRY